MFLEVRHHCCCASNNVEAVKGIEATTPTQEYHAYDLVSFRDPSTDSIENELHTRYTARKQNCFLKNFK